MATLTHRQTLVRAKTHVGAMGSLGLAFQAAATETLATSSFTVIGQKGRKSHAFLPGMGVSLCGSTRRTGRQGGDGKGCPTCGNCNRLVAAVKS